METNKWLEDLIWCPSQIDYYFQDIYGRKWNIYLRWRWSDPWTAKLIPCDDNWIKRYLDTWETLHTSKEYKDYEYKELESEVLEIIKAKFPGVEFYD